jgi:hypothetical protein
MRRDLRERSTLGIIKDTFEIYLENFRVIFLASLLALPFASIQDCARILPSDAGLGQKAANLIGAVGLALSYVTSLFVVSLVTILISNVWLGYRPSLSRAYKRFFSRIILKMLVTYVPILLISAGGIFLAQSAEQLFEGRSLLQLGIPVVTALLLVVFLALTLFIPCVVVLEGSYWWAAYHRSIKLSLYQARYFGRNVLYELTYAFSTVLALFLVFVISILFNWIIASVFKNLLFAFVAPLASLCVVLLYYDVLVRKEGVTLVDMEDRLQTIGFLDAIDIGVDG